MRAYIGGNYPRYSGSYMEFHMPSTEVGIAKWSGSGKVVARIVIDRRFDTDADVYKTFVKAPTQVIEKGFNNEKDAIAYIRVSVKAFYLLT